jgi:histone-lysine N-methyltransferase SETMAR
LTWAGSLEDEVRSGRPISATAEENVDAVKAMVEEDARVTVSQIEQELGISSGSVRMIMHEKLHLSKISARWVPHMLTQEQKNTRVQWCRKMLTRFDGGRSNAVWEIISGDESWVYSFDPETKQQSAQWTPVGGAPP